MTTTYTTADIYTDMVGEFPTAIEDFAVELIQTAYAAYRQSMRAWPDVAFVDRNADDGYEMYASCRQFRDRTNYRVPVTVVFDDGTEQGFMVQFSVEVDDRDPESALVEYH